MLAFINKYLIGPILPVTVFAAGSYFIFRLRGFPFTKARFVTRAILSDAGKDGVSPFSALTISLAGTLGVGNIVGVASAIAIGGAGAVLWMLLSAAAAMSLKYAEVALAVLTRKTEGDDSHGGPYFYIKNRALARLFAALIVVVALPLGSLIQVRAAADCALYCFNLHPIFVGAAFALLCALIVGGGLTRLSAFTVKFIPALSLCYILLSIIVIAARFEALPSVVRMIVRDAFEVDSAFGGIIGFLISAPLRAGVSRGILSNEAGLGSSPIAHAHSNASDPVRQGAMGIFEVFADTILLCTLTALAILSSGIDNTYDGGMVFVLEAFGSVMDFAPPVLAVSITLFAFATVTAWAHYGLEALRFLTKSRALRTIYIALYSTATLFGAVIPAALSWELAETLTGIMTIMNTSAVAGRSDEISAATFSALRADDAHRRSPMRSATRAKSSASSEAHAKS